MLTYHHSDSDSTSYNVHICHFGCRES